MTIVTLDKTNRVHSANIGDSGYKWMRRFSNGKFQVLFQTVEQQHSFNFPYQLGSANSKLAKSDSPSDAIVTSHVPQHGDFFLVGSDGLFDNIFMPEILTIMNRYGAYNHHGEMINKDYVARILA